MTTTLTAPVVQQATTATIDEIDIVFARNADLTVDAPNSQLSVRIKFRTAGGVVTETRILSRPGDQLPTAVRNAVISLQNALITAARAAGVLPAGTDTADL